jgi:hypothetical protein
MVRLAVPTPTPEHLQIASSFDTVDRLDTYVVVPQVLESGVAVIANADHSPDANLLPGKQVPGEVLIFSRKLTARNRMP